MPASTVITGRSGSVLVGAHTLCVTSWEVTNTAERQDVTDSCDGNARKFITLPVMTEGSAKGYWNNGTIPYTACAAGTSATIVCSLGNSGRSFTIPAIITSDKVTNTVLGMVEFEISFAQTAAITYPS